MKKVALMLLILAATACSDGMSSSDEADPTALVSVARAVNGPISETVTLYGAAEAGAAGAQVLVAQTDSVVTKISAPVGSKVLKGDEIATLAPAPASRLDLDKARAEAKAADAAFARTRRLRADGLASDADVDNARALSESAKATLNSLEGRVDALVLRAPKDGYVSEFAAKAGDQIAAGAPVATIAAQAGMRARFGADPAIARILKSGMAIAIRPSAGQASYSGSPASPPIDPPGDTALAKAGRPSVIEAIDPVVDAQTRLASVFAPLPPAADVAIGEALTARITIGRDAHAVIIPYAALLNDGGQPYVYVVANGVAHRHDIVLGPVDGDRASVKSGVAPGDAVVIEGGTGVEDGMKVRTK